MEIFPYFYPWIAYVTVLSTINLVRACSRSDVLEFFLAEKIAKFCFPLSLTDLCLLVTLLLSYENLRCGFCYLKMLFVYLTLEINLYN